MSAPNINDVLMKSNLSAAPSTGDSTIDKLAEDLRTHYAQSNCTDPYFEQKYIRAQNALIDYVWYQSRPTKLHYQEKMTSQYSDQNEYPSHSQPSYGRGAPPRPYSGYQHGSSGPRRYNTPYRPY